MKKKIIGILVCTLLIIAFTSATTSVNIKNKGTTLAPSVDVEKEVWDPIAEEWVEEIDVKISYLVDFKISVHNTGDEDFTRTKVVDYLLVPRDNTVKSGIRS